MNLHHLAVFHAVAKAGGVNAAAAQLHTSQPAISRELKTLEDRLGSQLFERLPRGMQITAAGEVLLEFAERIFAIESAAEREMQGMRNAEDGDLRIGASNTLGNWVLPPVIARFRLLHPKVRLHLAIANTEQVIQGVEDSRYAIGFVEGTVKEQGVLEMKQIGRDRLIAVASPVMVERLPHRPTLRQLAAAPGILREPGSGTRESVVHAMADKGLVLSDIFEVGSSEALKQAAIAGAGVGWISELCVIDELQSGRLVQLPTGTLKLWRPLSLLRLRRRRQNEWANRFVSML